MEKYDFNTLAKTHESVRMRLRFLALAHFQEGHSRTAIAKFLKVSRASVNKWVTQYHLFGMDGLIDKKTTGRPFRLSDDQHKQLIDFVTKSSKRELGGRLNGSDIQLYIEQNFAVHYHLSSVYKLLHKLGFSWITSRSKHPKQSIEAQENFKKIPIKNDP
jgi:transposase